MAILTYLITKKQEIGSGNILPIQNIFIPVCIADVLSQHPHYHSDQIFIDFTLKCRKSMKEKPLKMHLIPLCVKGKSAVFIKNGHQYNIL